MTALMYACKHGHTATAELLIEGEAGMEVKSKVWY
jgi:ankyrin repeat protein